VSLSGDQMAAVAGGLGAIPPHAGAPPTPVLRSPEDLENGDVEGTMPDDPITDDELDEEGAP